MRRLDPRRIKQLGAFDNSPDFQKVFIFHDKSAIVIKFMLQDVKHPAPLFSSLPRPLLASIAPRARPFRIGPRVSNPEESFALVLHSSKNTVIMQADKSCTMYTSE